MYFDSQNLHYSPSDLTQYIDSPFASWMEHLACTHPECLPMPDEEDAMMALLKKQGEVHELKTLAMFREQGLEVIDLSQSLDGNLTLTAMQSGVDVIYQATLELQPFRGQADFLVKVPGKSGLGDFYYEVWDTKLSKTIKPYFLVQLCCYAEMLEALQGRLPEYLVVVLGTSEQKRLRTEDYFYYTQHLKQTFLQAHQEFSPHHCPDPADSTSWGRWSEYAEELFKKADHLSRVATMTKSQIKKLEKAGIHTMQALAHTEGIRVKGMSSAILERLKAQAAIQKASEGQEIPLYKMLPWDPSQKRGLALLPPDSPNDIFFDIEGYPLEEGGLEYLWGVTYFDEAGARQYKDFWAHNQGQEKEAFRAFIEWTYGRWIKNQNMHIYHYANYEIAACRKLMGRYGICEHEVDQLLRNEVFVDLYKVVKGSLLLGEPRYSIKNVEHLYRPKRATEVGSGGDSVVVYEHWRSHPDGDTWETSKILNDIREYNIDDCNSTQELVDWFRLRQQEQVIPYLGKTELVEPELKEEINERIQLRDKLLQKAAVLKEAGLTEEARVTSVLAWSLEFHRRESKPIFWRLFDRMGLLEDELLDDLVCLAQCTRTDKPPYKPTEKARQLAYEYAFDPNQEFKGTSQRYYVLGKETAEGKNLTVNFIKEGSRIDQGYIVLQMKDELDEIVALIPDEYVRPDPIPEAIAHQVEAFEQGKLKKSAMIDFLTKSIPRISGHLLGQPIAPSREPEQRLQEIIQAVMNLDHSCLTIQGPPGAGKTHAGKHIIAELLKQGKKIGISSNSHKAINNLLMSTAQYCQQEQINGYFACTKKTEEALDLLGVELLENKDILNHLQSGTVIGTTAWGFARAELEDAFDTLFIDEAGQVSVANLIAMSRSTKNMVLMGDQMQLGQPSQGDHPEDSGLSLLDYLLHATPTIPDSMGVFLGTTYRMHSAVNEFISEAIYEGKLESAPENDEQRVKVPEDYQGILDKEAGIISVPVVHEGNTQASDEEVEQIVNLAHQLIGRTFTAKDGAERQIGWEDILFVAPYNHQVNKLKVALGEQAIVGSVDRFQGQQAPIVFLSMCASNANESPRGMDFLFDKNRINVAISRAQSLAIVVYSPTLLEASASNTEQLGLINLFCRLVVRSG